MTVFRNLSTRERWTLVVVGIFLVGMWLWTGSHHNTASSSRSPGPVVAGYSGSGSRLDTGGGSSDNSNSAGDSSDDSGGDSGGGGDGGGGDGGD